MKNTIDMRRFGRGRIGVIGDFCLDVYWHADMTKSELSRETPHFPLPIVQERLSPGGAGNVVMNLLALKPKAVHAVGVFGDRGGISVGDRRQGGVRGERGDDQETQNHRHLRPG